MPSINGVAYPCTIDGITRALYEQGRAVRVTVDDHIPAIIEVETIGGDPVRIREVLAALRPLGCRFEWAHRQEPVGLASSCAATVTRNLRHLRERLLPDPVSVPRWQAEKPWRLTDNR